MRIAIEGPELTDVNFEEHSLVCQFDIIHYIMLCMFLVWEGIFLGGGGGG